ncbi:GTP-binding protein [Streptomyces resistomycificus]|uniref:ATP-binding protein n=1 Tax=Streptomyces resistomycificus TaxID=67356 RepID=A0A0L8KT93_9ACTN|nr:GTP-binding protein [Streptomyces resistomycificus]KOG29122.1 ATP-binding protein [Streptomyces resistomycificus]KUN91027.1 ATP-binding protein [Streptomyces resistomycificus]
MTAVTDQDHTDHTNHTEHADHAGGQGHADAAGDDTGRAEERSENAASEEGTPQDGRSTAAGPDGEDVAEGPEPAAEAALEKSEGEEPEHRAAGGSKKSAAASAGKHAATGPEAPAKDRHARVQADSEGSWDDGLIARRVTEETAAQHVPTAPARPSPPQATAPLAYDGPLRSRLDALRELVGLSRTRLDSRTLAEAGRVLDEAASRRRLSGQHTVVAIAGATGSGKSQLFNTLAGVTISETGVRRPTTAAPIACSWSDGAAGLIDRLGIPGRLRRRPVQSAEAEAQLRGLVLVDLPDHDSAAVQHREQVDRVLALVDAVIWVVDPEKYADAVLHERYLRPMAGHAEVMFVVLNQIDRLPGEATEQVLDDLRRLLDEDGIALGEYGEPGATVLALSALTGDGVGELRESLGQFLAERGAPARRIAADVDAAGWRLRSVYATGQRTGLSEEDRDEFAARLAEAIGATAAGEAAERAWLRNANRACGTPWLRLWRWYQDRLDAPTGRFPARAQVDEEATARQRVEQAVRTLAERASTGLPAPWGQAVREAAVRGAQGLPEALDELAARAGLPPGRPPRPGWWPAAVFAQASMTILQVVGGLWLLGQIIGFMSPNLGVPVLLMVAGIIGGPLVEWSCRMAARGPARRYGQEAERRLREASAGCGRARVLDPVAAELLRYREVREQYGRLMGVPAAR